MMSVDTRDIGWIAVDWGTTHLRVWAVGKDGQVIVRRNSDRGMSKLAQSEFEPALMALIADLLPVDRDIVIIACGMVGSRQGWTDAGYVAAPCAPLNVARAAIPGNTGLSLHILPGIKQTDPADVMRGEETQIAGFLRKQPDFDGVVCLPGTHSKWVHVSAGEIVSFQTFMTGELYSLLSQGSVLRHAMLTDGWDSKAFGAAISDAAAHPAAFSAQLFRLRASSLLDETPPETARARLSGLLIGLELVAARAYWLGRNVAVVGRNDLARLYMVGLRAQGLSPQIADYEDMALLGLTAAYETLTEAAT